MIWGEKLSFSYGTQKVFHDLSFQIRERDFVALIGDNGAGKTTLLRTIVGLCEIQQGTMQLFGIPMIKFKDWDLIGYVPQRNHFNPLFPATVQEVVLSGLYGRKKMFHRMTKKDEGRCADVLSVMQITNLAHKRIGALSGGQQQRVFLARALINRPKLLILDEPFTGIDAKTQTNFFHLIQHMHEKHKMTIILVSHDLELVTSYFGHEPKFKADKLKFFVKHAKEIEDCSETNLLHSLRKEG